MELAAAALGSLLPKLATLLTDEYKLQKGVRGEIRFLQAEMESMQAALDRVSKLPPEQIDDLCKIWVRDLKELSYDIEDSVDSFMIRVDAPGCAKPHSFRRFFDRTIGLLTKAKARHHIGDDIQDIKKRIRDVSERKDRYNSLDVVQPHTIDIDPRLPALYEDAAKLVGIEGPTQKVIDLLNRGGGVQTEKLMVVSIVGVGGLGKTTIANSVYERLGGQFQCQAFVSVSLKPNLRQILSSILRQVSEDKCTNAGEKDLDELIKSIRKFLVKKRYLIVIDDIWDKEAWAIIKCALIDNNIGSKVIVTTRNIDVANISSVDGEVYELDPLSYKDSRTLLCKRVFNEEDEIYSELEEVANKILKKCGGVPLAIITISSLLASIPNKTKCEWYGVYSSMGSGLHKEKSFDNMRSILYLSYSDMPSYLKPCLLYLSMFPEDFKIQSDDLVGLWIAEGFINEKQGSNMYDLGQRYFNELANRSMIQPICQNGTPVGCRVHDMVLDLIISLSAEENCHHIRRAVQHIFSLQDSTIITARQQERQQGRTNDFTSNIEHIPCQVPRWFSSLSELSVLCMRVELLRQEDLKLLGALPVLRFLYLHVDPDGITEEERLVVGADQPFRSLSEFQFINLTKCWLEFARGVMPKLQRLELCFEARKREGGGFDIGLENLASLRACLVGYQNLPSHGFGKSLFWQVFGWLPNLANFSHLAC